MQHLELLGGVMRFDSSLLFLDLLLLAHFIYSYYKYCYCKGFTIDYWHFTVFVGFVIPTILIYPFAGSSLNILSTGSDIIRIQELVDKAYLISAIGYICTYAGFYYFNLAGRRSLLYLIADGINDTYARYIYNSIDNKLSVQVCYLVGLVLSIAFIGIALPKYGMTLNLRNQTLGDPMMKPFFNFVLSSYIPVISTFLLLRYIQHREKVVLFMYLTMAFVIVMSGSRGAILAPLVAALTFYAITKRRQTSITKLAVAGMLIMITAFYLGDLRSGDTSLQSSLAKTSYSVAYGNNFSDVRDFAWTLSYWNNEFLLGKTYLAGLMGFVPRSLSAFRTTWAVGVYIDNLIGFDPAVHPGLRPGKFGEAYLNFGIIGVVILGWLGGYVLRYVDMKIKYIAVSEDNNVIKMYAFTLPYIIVSQLYITAGVWAFYVFIFILMLGYLARQLLRPFCREHVPVEPYPGSLE